MIPVRLTRLAEEDLLAAVDFYELQETGAGDLLFRAIMKELRRLETIHGFHRRRHGFHKLLASRFPHAIYYEMFPEEIVVVAIIDERRNPASIQRDLSRRPSGGVE